MNLSRNQTIGIVIVVLAITLLCCCPLVALSGLWASNGMEISNPFATATTAPEATTVAAATPIPTAVPGYCDPTTVVFTDMGELNPLATTTIAGPAIYEWWIDGAREGVQFVGAGESVELTAVRGHWWKLPADASQLCLNAAWELHVANYAAKPQHAGKTREELVVPPPALEPAPARKMTSP